MAPIKDVVSLHMMVAYNIPVAVLFFLLSVYRAPSTAWSDLWAPVHAFL